MSDLKDVLAVLDLRPTGESTFEGDSLEEGGGSVVFGGQLLAQSLLAAGRCVPGKEVLSMHTIFARSASAAEPLAFDVDVMQAGRAFGSATVTVSQGGKVCVRSLVHLHAPDPDLIRHADPAPTVTPPDELASADFGGTWWDIRTVDGVDISDPDAVGPAELRVWTRFPDASADDLAVNQALLAYASDGFLIGTAMRPHAGIGQSMAHVSISTTVLNQTLTFHEPFNASEWLLLDQCSSYAGRGRTQGLAEVFTADGRLVASFSQVNMVRDFPQGTAPAAGQMARH